jgi:putative endonuclease
MFCVYILKSKKDRKTYVGYSENIKRRFEEHNNGLVKATKYRRPLSLIYFECFNNEKDAKKEELFLKSGKGRERMKYLLKNTFKELE